MNVPLIVRTHSPDCRSPGTERARRAARASIWPCAARPAPRCTEAIRPGATAAACRASAHTLSTAGGASWRALAALITPVGGGADGRHEETPWCRHAHSNGALLGDRREGRHGRAQRVLSHAAPGLLDLGLRPSPVKPPLTRSALLAERHGELSTPAAPGGVLHITTSSPFTRG